jgi:hypothetical protein
VALLVLFGGTGLGFGLQAYPVALAGFLLGTVAVAAALLWEFARHEAALRVSLDERQILLERHYRDRILWRRALPWHALTEAGGAPGPALVLVLRHGRRLNLTVPFRTDEQVAWVVAQLRRALDGQRDFEATVARSPERDRLERLLGEVDTAQK